MSHKFIDIMSNPDELIRMAKDEPEKLEKLFRQAVDDVVESAPIEYQVDLQLFQNDIDAALKGLTGFKRLEAFMDIWQRQFTKYQDFFQNGKNPDDTVVDVEIDIDEDL